MSSTKAIRKRINSVKNTQKITKAMKMVAAAKLRRAQNQILALRPYEKGLSRLVKNMTETLQLRDGKNQVALPPKDDATSALLQTLGWAFRVSSEEKRIRLLLVTSDRGLSGGFNSNVFRRAEQFLVEKEGCHIDIDVIGKKGRDYVKRRIRPTSQTVGVVNRWLPHTLVSEQIGIDSKHAAAFARSLATSLQGARQSEEIDAVYVIYNQFHSAAKQTVTLQRLLPIEETRDQEPAGPFNHAMLEYLYEPSKEQVLFSLLPLFFEIQLSRILLDSIASQFGAQMSAMDNASRNAKDMISRLTLQMNRARQAAITKELMEIIGGAEALKG